MIAGLKPYSAYKDSGVPWLGEVPAHWEVLPNRATFSEVSNREHPQEQMLSVTIAEGVVRQKELLEDSSKKDSSRLDKTAYKLVEPGDVAYNKMRAWQGAVGVSKHRGIISPAYVVQRPRNGAHSRYLHYLLRTPAFAKEAERWSYGITSDMWSLRPEHFKMIYGCLPPLPEQTAIVRFLDHADRRIRRYIRAKQKLIALLEEQKQAIIHQAVTGQIDVRTGQPHPAYKPSGVEWLGDVPAHWQVRRVKQVSRIQGGFAFSSDMFGNEGVPVVRMLNIHRGVLCLDDVVRVPESQCKTAFALEEGDIVYGLSGSIGATGSLGNYAVVRKTDLPAQLNQRVARFQPMTDQLADSFLVRSLQTKTFYEQVLSHTSGTAQFNVSTKDIGNVAIALPPVDGQQQIVQHLSSTTTDIGTATAKTNREIDLLREYRTRLIADVVTGKLDVREAAAALPEVDPLAAEDTLDDTLDTDAV